MKVLIGTPIHISKDYSMRRWLRNVARLQKKSPADLLIVDNSPGIDYVKRIKTYCKKYGIINYEIEHIESLNQGKSVEERDTRIERSQEIIKRKVLSKDYDAWFSWESDVFMPANALGELIKIMEAGKFTIVTHNCWARGCPGSPSADFEISLISRRCLEKYGSLLAWASRKDYFNIPEKRRYGFESGFKNRVLKNKGSTYAEIYNVIKPIYHPDK